MSAYFDGPVSFAFRELVGFSVESVDGAGVARIEVGPQHHNPNGVVHGAVPYALIDTAMGSATSQVLPDGSFCATIDIHVRYLRPASGGELVATATVRRAGKRIVHLDASVVDGDGIEIAAATGSYAVLQHTS